AKMAEPVAPGEAPRPEAAASEDGEGSPAGEEDDEDDEYENNLSLSAMEAELKPQVVETFDRIAETYGKMRELQDRHMENQLAAKSRDAAEIKRLEAWRSEVIVDVKSLSLNNSRIESLVEQLYDINKRLMRHEGRLMRLADSYGIKRDAFLKAYYGSELDQDWDDTMAERTEKGWTDFITRERATIDELRGDIQTLATETGL